MWQLGDSKTSESMSTIRMIRVFVKLFPSILALRRDRQLWINSKENQIDSESFRRHARRFLDVFVTLGPVYIKLGQWLSSRADILPQPYLEELAKLQDSVPSAPFDQVKPIIEDDLGPIDEHFDSIDPDPISGASLGQVYRGVISNQQIVIKVKRPGIELVVEQDLKILKKILPLGLRFVDKNLRFSAKAMLAQFIETIHEELDYTNESKNLKRIKRNMEQSDNVLVPLVFDQYSSKNVLTMEYLPGIKVTNVQALEEKGIDRKQLVIDVHKVFFTMLLKYSIFHADPHPGNISVTDNGKLILYDYGMVGRINEETRHKLIRLYLALVEKSPSRVVNAMSDLGMLTPGYNRAVMEKGIELSISAMHGNRPDEMQVQSLIEFANQTMSRFPFVLPKNLALYMRMASIIEGIYKTHDVDFRFVKVLQSILEEENLISRAYVEEIKITLDNFVKSIDAAIKIGPEMRNTIDEFREHMRRPKKTVLIAGSIFASSVFLGSMILYTTNELVAVAGVVCSGIIMIGSYLLRNN